MKTYRELQTIHSFEDRYQYLKLTGIVGDSTFGYDRYLNQILYISKQWKRLRDDIIIRDNGCDLGIEEFQIPSRIIVHHITPITLEDVELRRSIVFDPNNLICSSHNTHNAIHYGDISLLPKKPIVRQANDTCPWK